MSEDWRKREETRLKETLQGNKAALKLLDALMKIHEAANYGCKQCFAVSVIVDKALKEA